MSWPYGQPHSEKCLIDGHDKACVCRSRWATFWFKVRVVWEDDILIPLGHRLGWCNHSTDICGGTSSGFGKLDPNGFWQYQCVGRHLDLQ